VRQWEETSAAAVRAATGLPPSTTVTTQGHVLTVQDFISTLVVEAAVHHLDLVVDLDGRPGPADTGLAVVSEVLSALLRAPAPAEWDDTTLALKATGRLPLSADDLSALGPAAERIPVFS